MREKEGLEDINLWNIHPNIPIPTVYDWCFLDEFNSRVLHSRQKEKADRRSKETIKSQKQNQIYHVITSIRGDNIFLHKGHELKKMCRSQMNCRDIDVWTDAVVDVCFGKFVFENSKKFHHFFLFIINFLFLNFSECQQLIRLKRHEAHSSSEKFLYFMSLQKRLFHICFYNRKSFHELDHQNLIQLKKLRKFNRNSKDFLTKTRRFWLIMLIKPDLGSLN